MARWWRSVSYPLINESCPIKYYINGYYFELDSGGSIWIETPTFDGYGLLAANGGSATGGGGSGGRIAVYATLANSFIGTITASGGASTSAAGPGMIIVFDIVIE